MLSTTATRYGPTLSFERRTSWQRQCTMKESAGRDSQLRAALSWWTRTDGMTQLVSPKFLFTTAVEKFSAHVAAKEFK
jgi:hypothetical protein